MTLLIENICLYLLIDLLNLQPMISKVCVSFITILSNYILCKFKIFKERSVFVMDKISVIVPCFNEEDVLPLFLKK